VSQAQLQELLQPQQAHQQQEQRLLQEQKWQAPEKDLQ
jgi:hypothetical protein